MRRDQLNRRVHRTSAAAKAERHQSPQVIQRGRAVRAAPGGSGGGSVGWFKLSAVASNPMTGKLQTCSAGSLSDASGAEDTDVYIHPGSELANYAVNAYVFASYVGDCWVSVNIFSSDDEVEDVVDDHLADGGDFDWESVFGTCEV